MDILSQDKQEIKCRAGFLGGLCGISIAAIIFISSATVLNDTSDFSSETETSWQWLLTVCIFHAIFSVVEFGVLILYFCYPSSSEVIFDWYTNNISVFSHLIAKIVWLIWGAVIVTAVNDIDTNEEEQEDLSDLILYFNIYFWYCVASIGLYTLYLILKCCSFFCGQ